MDFDQILKSKGIELPEVPKPVGSYASLVECEGLVFLSGLLPRKGSEILYRGKVGADITLEAASEAARLCALNALSVIKSHYGSLDHVRQILKIVGYVQSHPGFYDQPRVLNGASDLFGEIFDKRGVHARSAVGVSSLPGNAACEIELTLKVS